jgi:Protein of unknown function (DUF3108)
MKPILSKIIAPVLAMLILPASVQAETREHLTEFDVVYGILPVGTASFLIKVDGENYVLGAKGKTVGVAEMLAPGAGEAISRGHITDNGVVAEHHTVLYREKPDSREQVLELDFHEGDVKKVRLSPDNRKPKKSKKWVRITEEQLRQVIDPASTIIVAVEWKKANDPRAVCERRLKVYDGGTRFDIQLHYKATKPISTKGYRGYAFVCQLRYIPVSGHKTGQKNINYMRDNKNMEIWLAPMAKSNLYTPIRIEVPTWVGTISAIPRFFGTPSN